MSKILNLIKKRKDKIMKKIVKIKRPGGFLDILPAEYLAREKIIKKIDKNFRLFGFNPIETPIVEFTETLAGEESETGKNIFYVKNAYSTKEESLALRFDQTIPLARVLAANPYNHNTREGIMLPWRRMACGLVFRGEKPQSGRYRQFYQFDADIVGSNSMMAEVEIISMIYKTLKALNIDQFVIEINNRKILNGLAELADITDNGKVKANNRTKQMMRILDKIDKIGTENVLKELQKKPISDSDFTPNLSKATAEKIKSFLSISGNNVDKLIQCQEIFSGIMIAQEGIAELKEIINYLAAIGMPEKNIEINFSIARGLDYYTGPVIETFLNEARQFGSICSGGRYDNLIGRFMENNIPAVGVSIGIDRLLASLYYLKKIDHSKKTETKIMILRLMANANEEYLRIANELRKIGLNTEICLLKDISFKNQFNFAVSRGVDLVVIYGEDERNKGIIQIKDLNNREQKEMKRSELSNYFNK